MDRNQFEVMVKRHNAKRMPLKVTDFQARAFSNGTVLRERHTDQIVIRCRTERDNPPPARVAHA